MLDPVFQDVRSRNFQTVTLRCTVLRSNPPRLTDIRWLRNGEFIRMSMPDLKQTPELKFKLEPTSNGSYECRVSNSAGTSTCRFNVSGKWKKRHFILFIKICYNIICMAHFDTYHFALLPDPQHNHTMLSFILIHQTQCAFWREIITPTPCSGHKGIHRLLTVSLATG